MAALDAYAPDWLPKAESAIGSVKNDVSIAFGNLTFTTQSLDAGTLVQVGKGMTVTVNARGVQVSTPMDADGHLPGPDETPVPGPGAPGEQQNPPDSAARRQWIIERISGTSPDVGFVTVEENGKWFVSPVRTVLQGIWPRSACSSPPTSRPSSPALRRSSPTCRTTFCNWVTT